MAKKKQFQVVIEMKDGKTIFIDTNKSTEASSWVDTFIQSEGGLSIKIFQFDNHLGYDLTYSYEKETQRKIGFCR